MKVLDPQTALLTTAEVYQFLGDNPVRPKDKKIGSYAAVDLTQLNYVRKDVTDYVKNNLPNHGKHLPADVYIPEIVQRLKPYDLTKSEVYSLINLGVGFYTPAVNTTSNAGTPHEPDTQAQAQSNGERNNEDESAAEEAVDEPAESILGQTLFRAIVEEVEDRFPGDEGEKRIEEILEILRESTRGGPEQNGIITNGHTNDAKDED